MSRRIIIVAALLVVAGVLWAIIAPRLRSSTYSNELGKAWPAAERISYDNVDHSAWNSLLGRYVDSEGMVNYRAWKASDDASALERYLEQLSQVDPNKPSSREAKLAFWINAYNAVTVEGILREYPTSSIRNHTGLVGYNLWDHLLLRVGEETFSLNTMEHEILRKMGEPRIHFAIVCASIGCPRLLNEAYAADRIDEQLTENAKNFFSQDRNFRFDKEAGQIFLSSILDWFGSDFGDSQAAQLARISPYLPSDEARQVAVSENVTVSYLDYDWNLNEQH